MTQGANVVPNQQLERTLLTICQKLGRQNLEKRVALRIAVNPILSMGRLKPDRYNSNEV